MPTPSPIQRFNLCFQHAVSSLPKSPPQGVTSKAARSTRYAIILGVASMDAYFTKKFMQKLTGYLKRYKLTRQNDQGEIEKHEKLVNLLHKAGIDETQYLKLLEAERPYRVIYTIVEKHLGTWTTNRFGRIDDLFKIYGITDLTAKSMNQVKTSTSIQPRLCKSRIERLVDRRNLIAHSCDLNSHNQFNRLNLQQVKEGLQALEYFVIAAEDVLGRELK